MAPGFLAVFSEPGDNVTPEEFQSWYDDEHVPIRLNHLSSFLTGARYSASDSLQPSWVALYDIDDTAAFQHESYTRLRTTRSPREADLIKRLDLLDRRTYELLWDENKGLTSSYHPKDPTKFILTQGVECTSDEHLKKWADGVVDGLKGAEGWTRTRIYKCIDTLKIGLKVGSGVEEQKVPGYMVIHEFLHPAAADAPLFKSLLQQHSEVKFIGDEERRWGLYRAYPAIAQNQS